jgi:GH25 family lysozyme M1 (1,4-beta-N-acetylmuramidase)
LIFTTGSTVNVYGEIMGTANSEIFVSDTLIIREAGVLSVYGSLMSSLNSKIDILGKFNANENFKTSGVFNLYPNATLINRGVMHILPSGSALISGKFTSEKNTELKVYGIMQFSTNGNLISKGSFAIHTGGSVTSSGLIVLETGSEYLCYGTYTRAKNGVLTDKRDCVDFDLLTAAAIANEPEVLIYGIDVSRWNEEIDWSRVALTNAEFVMIRAGRGAVGDNEMIEDPKFLEYIQGAQEHGIETGVYFYSYATNEEEIKKEAEFLLTIIKDQRITYPVALDMEEKFGGLTKDKATVMVEAFFKVITDAGYFPILYSYKNWLEDHLDERILDKYTVWVAHTKVSATTYSGNYYMWQYSHTGRVSGLEGDVDLNISYRDFAAYIKQKNLNNLN